MGYECPECNVENNINGMEEGNTIICDYCGVILELVGYELVCIGDGDRYED